MEMVFQVLRVLVIFFLIKRIIWIFIGVLHRVSSSALKNEIDLEENVVIAKPIETVLTHCCNKSIQKEKAYQAISKDGEVNYFCSWDCRQQYLKNIGF